MNSRATARLILAAVCAMMAWTVRQAAHPALLLVSWDLHGHLLRARHFLDGFSAVCGFTAWFPYWHGGLPLSEVYPPLTTWALAAFGAGAGGARLFLVVCWIAIVPCSYFFLRSFRMDRVPAAAGAALSAALNAYWTFGAYAIFTLGLVPSAVGLLLAALTLGSARRLLDGGAHPRSALARTALLGGLTILAHPFAAVWLGAALAILLISERLAGSAGRREIRTLLWACGGAVVIGAYYWAPFLANSGSLLVTEPFFPRSAQAVGRTMARLEGMGGMAAAAMSVLGLACLARPGRRSRLVLFGGLLLAGFVLATGVPAPFLPFAGAGRTQWARFEGFFGWTALMTAAFFVDAAAAFPMGRRRRLLAGTAIAAALAIAVIGVRRQSGHVSLVTPAAETALAELAAQLEDRTARGEFLLSENAVEVARSYGSPHFLNQRLPRIDPDLWDQGGSLPEGTAAAGDFFELSRTLPDRLSGARTALAAGGVRFVITLRRESREALDDVAWLDRRWSSETMPGMALYETGGFDRRFGLPPALSRRLADVNFTGRDGYRLRFNDAATLSYPLTVALGYHPWLRVTADGAPVEAVPGRNKRLELTRGPEKAREIRVRYSRPGWILPIRALALLALLAALVMARPRRRSALDGGNTGGNAR